MKGKKQLIESGNIKRYLINFSTDIEYFFVNDILCFASWSLHKKVIGAYEKNIKKFKF